MSSKIVIDFEEEKRKLTEFFKSYDEKMLVIAKKLAETHLSKHNLQFWRYFVGKWVFDYLYYLRENYAELKDAECPKDLTIDYFKKNNLSNGETTLLYSFSPRMRTIFRNTVLYFNKIYKDEKIDYLFPEPQKKILIKSNDPLFVKRAPRKNAKRTVVSMLWERLISEKHIFYSSRIFEKNDVCWLRWNLHKWSDALARRTAHRTERRQKLFYDIPCADALDFIFWHGLAFHLPKNYLESFPIIQTKARQTFDYVTPVKAIYLFSYHAIYQYTIEECYIAWLIEAWNPQVISIQHGGAYGMSSPDWSYLHADEFINCDYFASYGWRMKKEKFAPKNIFTMPNFTLLQNPFHNKRHIKKDNDILLCTSMEIVYHEKENFYTPYRANITEFLNKCCEINEASVEWRSYEVRYSFGAILRYPTQRKYVLANLNKTSNLKIDVNENFYQQAARCRLYVTPDASTTMLETMAENIPTICFWDPNIFLPTYEAKILFDKMKKLGMLFDSGEEAGEFVKKIYPNFEKWWQQPEVQQVRQEILDTYSKISPDIFGDYMRLFVNGLNKDGTAIADGEIIPYNPYRDPKYYSFMFHQYIDPKFKNFKEFAKKYDRYGVMRKFYLKCKEIYFCPTYFGKFKIFAKTVDRTGFAKKFYHGCKGFVREFKK